MATEDKRIDELTLLATPDGTELVLLEDAVTHEFVYTTASAIPGRVSSVSGRSGAVTLTKSDVGLSNVDNTSDASKPVSTATQAALDDKADAVHTHTEADITNLTADLAAKQDTLVSGTNIKTVNGSSLLGSGNLVIAGGGGSGTGDVTGPASSSLNTIATFADTTGKVIQDSGVNITAGVVGNVSGISADGTGVLDITANTLSVNAQIDANAIAIVNVADPTDPQDAATKNYVDTAVPSAIDDLSDVTITSPTNGQVLKYNSTTSQWVNDTDATASGSGSTNLSTSTTTTSVTIASDTGTDATIAAASGTAAGVLTASNKTKLDGIATGATANSTDAFLLSRANHTGTQTSGSISDFNSAVDARIAAETSTGTGTNVRATSPTLTTPKIGQINDTNGNTAAVIDATASAVNYLHVANGATGNAPAITADGSDTNINLFLRGKGTGSTIMADGGGNAVFVGQGAGGTPVNYITATNAATTAKPTIAAIGSDTNVSLNLTSKGSGTVQANGIDIATLSGTQTLTNKTISLASNTLSATSAQLAAALSDETGTGSAVFANTPSLTSPVLIGSASAPSTPSSGNGKLFGLGTTTVRPHWVNSTGTDEAIITDKTTTNLAWVTITSNFSTSSSSATQVTGLTTGAITAPGRPFKISVCVWALTCTATAAVALSIWDGTVGTGTQIMKFDTSGTSALDNGANFFVVVNPTAGTSKTYNIGMLTTAGTATLNASATGPATLLVEPV